MWTCLSFSLLALCSCPGSSTAATRHLSTQIPLLDHRCIRCGQTYVGSKIWGFCRRARSIAAAKRELQAQRRRSKRRSFKEGLIFPTVQPERRTTLSQRSVWFCHHDRRHHIVVASLKDSSKEIKSATFLGLAQVFWCLGFSSKSAQKLRFCGVKINAWPPC